MKPLFLFPFLFSYFSLPTFAQETAALTCKPDFDRVPVLTEPHGVKVAALLNCGQQVDILAISNGFAKIRLSETAYGYVAVENIIDSFTGNPAVVKSKPQRSSHLVTITKIYWFFSSERPQRIPQNWNGAQNKADGHLLAHADASSKDLKDNWQQLLRKMFVLSADGHEDIHVQTERGFWGSGSSNSGSDWYIRIPAIEYAKMVPKIPYTLKALDKVGTYRWIVADGVRIAKPETPTSDLTPGNPCRDDFPYAIRVKVREGGFPAQNDNIKIQAVYGTAKIIVKGETYCVTGIYSLQSRDEASLYLGITATGGQAEDPRARARITRGTGQFRLIRKMSVEGEPHVSMYPAPFGGSSMGGVYFH